MMKKITSDSNEAFVEDFWVPAHDRKQWPRTREDAENGEADDLQEVLNGDPDIVGLARHEPAQHVEDISGLPSAHAPETGVVPSSVAARLSQSIGIRPPTEK